VTQPAVDSSHGTLVASTVTTVNLDAGAGNILESIEVVNVDGNDEIYFVVNDAANPPSDPTVAVADSRVVPAVRGQSYLFVPGGTMRKATVKLISAGTPAYSVVGEKR